MKKIEELKIIERNHHEHFKFFPERLGFNMHEMYGASVINCGFGTSMFNIVYGTPFAGVDFKDNVKKIKEIFNGRAFAWWVPESERNPKLTNALLDAGLRIETIEYVMICDLSVIDDGLTLKQKTNLVIKQCKDTKDLQDFIWVLEPYDKSAKTFYQKIEDKDLDDKEKLFVGYIDGRPVTIAILFVSELSVGIFGLITRDEECKKGYGNDMMRFLLKKAKDLGRQHATLSASSDSGFRIYERLGFSKIGEFECFEFRN